MGLFIHFALLFASAFLVACSSGETPGESPSPATPLNPPVAEEQKPGEEEPLQGKINGRDWVFRSGRAYFRKVRTSHVVIQLWDEDIADPCKEKKGSALQVRLAAPKELATWKITPETPFNSELSIFFTDIDFRPKARDNMKADLGEIAFTAMDRNFVSGYLMGVFQNPKTKVKESHVVGHFVVPVCH